MGGPLPDAWGSCMDMAGSMAGHGSGWRWHVGWPVNRRTSSSGLLRKTKRRSLIAREKRQGRQEGKKEEKRKEVLRKRLQGEPGKRGPPEFSRGYVFPLCFCFFLFFSSYIITEMHCCWFLDGLCSIPHNWLFLFCLCVCLKIDLIPFYLLWDIFKEKRPSGSLIYKPTN